MAVRQYIGARYMPKFMGTYDATQAYEALSVVDNGMGTTYISRVPTPANTPLTDTDYWLVYGASSGAILDLQTRMGAAETELNDITNNKNGNILVIGNSYVARGCATQLMACFSHSYYALDGGTGFVAYTGHSTTFESVFDGALLSGDFDLDDITDLIFVSAMGDTRAYNEGASAYETALTSTLNSIMTKVANSLPNCKRVSITFAEAWKVSHFSDNKFINLFRVHKIFKTIPNRCGVEYLGWSGFNNLYVSSYIEDDNYHPTAAGAKAIGGFIVNSYFGNADYCAKNSTTFSVPIDYTAASNTQINSQFTPDSCTINFRGLLTTQNDAVTLTSGAAFLDTEDLNIPLPSPWQPMNVCVSLVDNSGVQKDFLRLSIEPNSDGVAILKANAAPLASVCGATGLQAPNLNDLFYTM